MVAGRDSRIPVGSMPLLRKPDRGALDRGITKGSNRRERERERERESLPFSRLSKNGKTERERERERADQENERRDEREKGGWNPISVASNLPDSLFACHMIHLKAWFLIYLRAGRARDRRDRSANLSPPELFVSPFHSSHPRDSSRLPHSPPTPLDHLSSYFRFSFSFRTPPP